MQDQLQKAINLAKKTGDRLIVYDMSQKNEAYVVMGLDEYERIAVGRNEIKGLTEDELLDKINRDIAVWKNEQNIKEEVEDKEKMSENKEYEFAYPEYEMTEKEEDEYTPNNCICDEEGCDCGDEEENKKNNWGIPVERKDAADEIIDEDTQYLEEVKF